MKPSKEEDRLLEINRRMAELQCEVAKLCGEVAEINRNNPRSPGYEGFMDLTRTTFQHWNKIIENIGYSVETWGIPLLKS